MRLRLLTKFTLSTSALVLAAMLIFAFANFGTLRDLWVREAIKDADSLTETIIRTTYYQMLEDDRARVFQMIQEVGSQKGIDHIRLIGKDGLIVYSTADGEIGQRLATEAEGCNVCHAGVTPLAQAPSMNRSRVFLNHAGEETLGLARPIYNQPECHNASCHAHSPESALLGILDVTISLEEINARMRLYRDTLILFTVLLLGILFVVLHRLTGTFVTGPVRQLLDHTRRLARGELEGEIKGLPHDEIGELGQAFNEMTVSLKHAQDGLRQANETLEERVEERSRAIEEMQSQLMHAEKLASLGEMVAGIAHEVNNPLTGVLMYASLALKEPDLPEPLRRDLQTIVNETQRCAGIVRGLLEFSRQGHPQKSTETLHRLIDSTLELVSRQPCFAQIEVARKYDPAVTTLNLDGGQIQQVLMNLFLNAAQAMPTGGVLTTATGRRDDDQIFIGISDTGCGIKSEHLAKIFDPFFTTKEHFGTGLGLSVSYGIVKSHGGNIEVVSREGEGTTFTIWLPVEPSRGM